MLHRLLVIASSGGGVVSILLPSLSFSYFLCRFRFLFVFLHFSNSWCSLILYLDCHLIFQLFNHHRSAAPGLHFALSLSHIYPYPRYWQFFQICHFSPILPFNVPHHCPIQPLWVSHSPVCLTRSHAWPSHALVGTWSLHASGPPLVASRRHHFLPCSNSLAFCCIYVFVVLLLFFYNAFFTTFLVVFGEFLCSKSDMV